MVVIVRMSGETVPKMMLGKKRRMTKMMVKPNRSKPARSRARWSGRRPVRTLKPSSGGRGKRLKTARETLRITPLDKI